VPEKWNRVPEGRQRLSYFVPDPEPIQSNAVQMQQLGRTQLELAFRIGELLDQLGNGVKLADAVPGLDLGFFVGIATSSASKASLCRSSSSLMLRSS
jgi:hypothetical protein